MKLIGTLFCLLLAARANAVTQVEGVDGLPLEVTITSGSVSSTTLELQSVNPAVRMPVTMAGGTTVALDSVIKEDVAAADGDDLFPVGVVRDDARSALPNADGDYTNLRTDGLGGLWLAGSIEAAGTPTRSLSVSYRSWASPGTAIWPMVVPYNAFDDSTRPTLTAGVAGPMLTLAVPGLIVNGETAAASSIVRQSGTTFTAGGVSGFAAHVDVVGLPSVVEVDSNNTTTTPLGNGATFTGTATDLVSNGSPHVIVSVIADQASAANGLVLQFSQDGTNWPTGSYSHAFTLVANEARTFQFGPEARHFRAVLTNGGSGQGTLRLTTLLKRNIGHTTMHRVEDDIDGDRSVIGINKAVLVGRKPDTTYTNVQVTANGNLKIAIEEGQVDSVEDILAPSNTPTIFSATAYVAEGTVGDVQEFTTAVRVSGQGGFIHTVSLIDDAGQNAAMVIFFFDRSITPSSDTQQISISEADMENYIGQVAFAAGNYESVGTGSSAMRSGLSIAFRSNATSIFAVMKTKGTPTYAATDDLTIKLGIGSD